MTAAAHEADALAGAACDLATAALATTHCRFSSAACAELTVSAYQLAADALRSVLGRLLWPRRDDPGRTGCGGGDAWLLPALRVEDALRTVTDLRLSRWPAGTGEEPTVARLWRSVALSLRTAQPRPSRTRGLDDGLAASTADEPRGDVPDRLERLLDVSRLARSLGESGEPIVAGAVLAGLDRTGLQPLAGAGADVARQARRLCAVAGQHDDAAWRRLKITRPRIRVGDPLAELGDRLARLHEYAQVLTRDRHAAAGDLTHYALVGQLLHQATLRLLSRLDARSDDVLLAPHADRIREGRAAWQTVHRRLQTVRGPGSPSAGVRADVERVTDLLATVTTPARPEALPQLLGWCRAFDQVALWNEAVLDRLVDGGRLVLVGCTSHGIGPCDRADVAAARLAGSAVPTGRLDGVRQGYHLAGGVDVPAVPAAVHPARAGRRHSLAVR